ncbi:MAG TPA: hypothetical protein VI794_00050 [Patescibacteria group bacterium]|nr:hypothetical protein [Patescibacteria group bacterium]
MYLRYGVVFTKNDHPCGKCRKVIPAGEKALEVIVPMHTPDKWGNEIPVKVPVRYHTGHPPKGLGSNS